MRVFVTGATGFIGSRTVARLRERGDEVVALVRSPSGERAASLRERGCELVEGSLADREAMRSGMVGCDAVIHLAAVYALGIPKSEQAAMLQSNIDGTEAALDAAIEAGVPRIVYVSTINVFGNTHGQVVDETYERDLSDGFLSTYDEAKYRAHEVALERIAAGAPIVVVQPGGVYGPGDHSELGTAIEQFRRGRLPLIPFPDMGIAFVHVDDVAEGIVLALDKGRVGESYLLTGENGTMRDLLHTTARVLGRRPPVATMPTSLMRLAAPLGGVIGPLLGFPSNFGELISASDGVTYWARDDKARSELGFAPRGLEQGLRDTLAR